MAKTPEDLVEFVSPYVLSCPYPLIETLGAQAMDEFCRLSGVWTEWIGVPVVAETRAYPLAPSLGFVFRVNKVIDNQTGRHLVEIDFPEDERAGHPTCYAMTIEREISLFPEPDADGDIDVLCMITPEKTTPAIPDSIFESYQNILVEGILHRLMAMPGKAWSAMDESIYHYRRFTNGVVEANINSKSHYSKVI